MEWRNVVGYENYLQVNRNGEIRSIERLIPRAKRGNVLIQSKVLTPHPDPKGYMKIRTSVDGKKTNIKVHRAVAEAFIPNPFNKPQIDHIDGNKSNNSVDNLRWVTNRENYDYSYANGSRQNSIAALQNAKKTPEYQQKVKDAVLKRCSKKTYCFTRDGKYVCEYPSASEAGRAVGGTPSGVVGCCNGKYPTYKNYVFSYDRNVFGGE